MLEQSSTLARQSSDRLAQWGRGALGLFALGCVAYTSFGLYLTIKWMNGGLGSFFSLVTLTFTWIVAVGTSLLVWFGSWRLPALVALCLPLLMFVLWCAIWPVTPREFTPIR